MRFLQGRRQIIDVNQEQEWTKTRALRNSIIYSLHIRGGAIHPAELFTVTVTKYGIIGLENTWFASYLENRMQFCRVNGVSSNVNNINCGLPQGSCLAPLLFLIYINDLPFSLQNSQVTMYADDTTISYSSNNIDDINDYLNRDLNCLKQWLQGNKLSLNVIKTQAMVVGSRPNLKKDL